MPPSTVSRRRGTNLSLPGRPSPGSCPQSYAFRVYSPAQMATFYDRFVGCAERWPTNIAVEVQRPSGVESYTYAELRQMAEAIAAWLKEQGIRPGSRVAILADNHPRWVVAYLGIIAAGGTAVPLDTNYDAQQVAKLIADSQSWLLISDPRHFEIAKDATRSTNLPIV